MSIDLTTSSSAFAETVEVSGGGKYEGDITPGNLNRPKYTMLLLQRAGG